MKTMKKIVAILAVAMLLCSVLPLSAFAAEATATLSFADKAQRTSFSSSAQVWEQNGIKFTNNKASSSNAVADYAKPVRLYAGSSIVIECTGMTKIEFDCNSTSYATALKNSIGTAATVSSDKVTVTLDGVDSYTVAKLTAQVRLDAITVTYEAGSADCDHDSLICGESCGECGEYTKEHAWNNTCDNECNHCGAANPDYAEHAYTTEYDATCNVCNAARDITLPTTPEAIVDAAYALGKGDTFGVATTLTGTVTKIVTAYDSSYANITVDMAVIDSEGNPIADKDIQCYRLKGTGADTLTVGQTIVVTGIITNFNGTIEFNAGCTLDEIIVICEHEYEFECDKACSLCSLELRPEAACVNDNYACTDGLCIYCGGDVDGLGHDFDDQWDPDCNYGCGETREVEEKPELVEATVTFGADKAQRTEYSTSVQKWENDGLTVLNEKGASTSNVGDYTNPARFYKSSTIIISFPGMTSLVIDATGAGSSYLWDATLNAAGLSFTVANQVYTITFADPTDSITLTAANQARAVSITAVAAKQSDDGEECAHEWNDATCTEPATCALCGAKDGEALGHNYVEDIIAATCTATGNKTYECSVCFDSYDETIPMKPHTYVDGICSACGAELPEEATITFGEDKAQRTEFGTESQKWENNGLVLINNKGTGNNIADYSAPIRMYKNSEIVISFPGMTSLVIDAAGINADYLWDATLEAAGLSFTVEEKIYTITFAEPTDSITLNAANQVRANSITASAAKAGCEHQYFDDCSAICEICGEEREVSHNIVYKEAVAPTCTALGNIEFWYCDVCGMAWLDEACTLNTNQMAVKLPMAEHEFFNDCETVCINCFEEVREASHNVIHVEAKAATCTANGNIEYWYCDVCGYAWLNAECTMNTNQMAIVLPATGEHTYDDEYDADCNVCGDIREVEEPVEDIIYGDADSDGEITNLDIIALQQFIAGWEVTMDEVSADADGDGEITNLDIIALQQFIAGWDVVLGPEVQEPDDGDNPLFNDGTLEEW